MHTAEDVALVEAEAFVFCDNEVAPAYRARAQVLGLTYATATRRSRCHGFAS